MYENYGKDIDCHAKNERSFRMACLHGHSNIAKYLVKQSNVDIHADDDFAIISACQIGDLDLAGWIFKLDEFSIIPNPIFICSLHTALC
jgi:hypothetical protein